MKTVLFQDRANTPGAQGRLVQVGYLWRIVLPQSVSQAIEFQCSMCMRLACMAARFARNCGCMPC